METLQRGETGWPRRAGAGMAVGGLAVCLALMINPGQPRWAPWLGIVALGMAIVGILLTLGVLRRAEATATPWTQTSLGRLPGEPHWTAPVWGLLAALAILTVSALVFGFQHFSWVLCAALASLIPAAWRRPGLAVWLAIAALYLPGLGTFGLIDCWETHYGEVAREILARDDWISLWWAQDGWFWSKPVLLFWSEALTMRLAGFDFRPDAHAAFAEWPVRLPVCLLALAALAATYAALQRVFGKRAAVFAVLVMATAPHFLLLAHQAITDMYFVGSMVIAMAMFVLALSEDPQRQVGQMRFGRWQFSAQAVLISALLLLVLPQILYLVSRNVSWLPSGLSLHRDSLVSGSAGNFGVPGNAFPALTPPRFAKLALQPAAQALLWTLGLTGMLCLLRRETRAGSLYMSGFYLACALAFLGKGLPGIVLPGLVVLLFLVATRGWRFLGAGHFFVARGIALVALVSMPWFVAMYVRHGAGFTNRLLIHDHINRLAAGVHGDKGDAAYFLGQFGYAMFPWIGLLPAALALGFWFRSRPEHSAPGETATYSGALAGGSAATAALQLVSLWFVAAFVLFNVMITKFHHYIFPAVPPAAILVGVALDRFVGDFRWRGVLPVALASLAWVLGLGSWFGSLRGIVPASVPADRVSDWVPQHGWPAWQSAAWVLLGGAAMVLGVRGLRPARVAAGSAHGLPPAAVAGVAVCMAASIAAFVGRDLSWATSTRPEGYERLMHLFVYMYERPWPQQFDYRPVLAGFSIVCTLGFALAVSSRLRSAGLLLTLCTSLLFSAWSLHVYLRDLAPHWSQRQLVARYYRARGDSTLPLVAWQMDWKGEQFYTGNRVAVFVSLDNRELRKWLQEHAGQRAFFIFQHERMATFRSLLGSKPLAELTTPRDNNKFVLVEARL